MNSSNPIRTYYLHGIACLLTLLWATFAHANIAGSVHFVNGQVMATASPNPARTLTKGADVFDRDSIETGSDGRLQMRFSDGGLVSLMPGTVFSVEEYRHDAQADDGKLVFNLVRGGLRTVTGAVGKKTKANYQLQTPVGTLGIRGTEFIAVMHRPDLLHVHVGRGAVVISNDYGTLEVQEGRSAKMALNSAPVFTTEQPEFVAKAMLPDSLPWLPVDDRLPELAAASFVEDVTSDPNGTIQMATATSTSVMAEEGRAVFNGNALSGFESTDGRLVFGSVASPLVVGQSGTIGGLKWGLLTAGAASINSPNVTQWDFADPDSNTLYLIGKVLNTDVMDLLNQGTLSYSLLGATPIFDMSAQSVGVLNHFSLDIAQQFGGPSYSVAMEFEMNQQEATMNATNELIFSSGSAFSISHYEGDAVSAWENCPGCSVNMGVFLTGPNAVQAGVTYQLSVEGNTGIGAAVLQKD